MRKKHSLHETTEEFEILAHDISDIKPLSPTMRRQWELAKRTGKRPRSGRGGVSKPNIPPP